MHAIESELRISEWGCSYLFLNSYTVHLFICLLIIVSRVLPGLFFTTSAFLGTNMSLCIDLGKNSPSLNATCIPYLTPSIPGKSSSFYDHVQDEAVSEDE